MPLFSLSALIARTMGRTDSGIDATTPGRVESRLRHFSEAFESLLPSKARHNRDFPVIMSSFKSYLPQIGASLWEPRCNHSTMARIYHEEFKCDFCRRQSQFGWLYRCTVDKDPLIFGAKSKGVPVYFDGLGSHFADAMTLGKFGPDARSKKHSLFNEISAEQMRSYTPQQIAVVLSQREDVHKAIAKERNQGRTPFHSTRQNFPDDSQPWMPDGSFECQHKVCHRCHSIGRDKSWVSLNGVLEGDILPNVAVGFSFSYMGIRPCTDANVVKNIGYQPVPLPKNHPARVGGSNPGSKTMPRIFDGFNGEALTPASLFSHSIPARKRNDTSTPTSENRRPTPNGFHIPLDGNAAATAKHTNGGSMAPRTMPCQSGESDTVDFPLDFEALDYTFACDSLLPGVDLDEERSVAEHKPLDGIGLELTEEAAEFDIADIVAYPTSAA